MTPEPNQPIVPTYRLYREQSGESGDFWLHCETIPERTQLHKWRIALHRHAAFFQIFSVTGGEGELLAGEAREGGRAFAAPCAVFIPPGAAHGFRFSRDVDGLVVTALADRLTFIAAADRILGAFLAATRIVPLEEGEVAAEDVAGSLRRIHLEMSAQKPGRAILLEAAMTQAVVALARAGGRALPSGTAGAPDLAERDRRRLDALDSLISTHLREHRPISFYAAALGVSPSHLNRLCRRHLGISVQARIARRVMEAARRDLVFTPTPIQAIAYSLGFQDPAYFNRFFRKMAGMTPGAFRETRRRRLVG